MTEPEVRDFSPGGMSSPSRAVGFDLEAFPSAYDLEPLTQSQSSPDSIMGQSPLRRRTTRSRSNTFRTVDISPRQPEWHPGQEPGLDPSKPDGGRTTGFNLHEECQITVVDFSEDKMVKREFNNDELVQFLDIEQEEWIKCRWININGLSWDVIKAVGKRKKLHRLAIEDMVNLNNRTKADWYTDHTYVVLTLQKLVHLHPDKDSDTDSDGEDEKDVTLESPNKRKRAPFRKLLYNLLRRRNPNVVQVDKLANGVHDTTNDFINGQTDGVQSSPVQKLRTLQRYHGGPNQERAAHMEKVSPLTQKKLAVSAEQVSIFLTADNTVISFFENSADDIETPILHRLSNFDTILRRSCDASMVMQAVIDAIIDLAIPVTFAYQDIIGSLELDVLTNPNIKHTTSLYVVTSEITTLRNFINPIANLINSLRDHKYAGQRGDVQKAASAVKISQMAQTYLGDVEDHIVLITESLDQLRRNADGMIDLIFNTISAYQNESMKQLTIVTIIFLPLSFLTGYFGMNFTDMPSIEHNEKYFWQIALPVAFAVICFLMRDMILWWFRRTIQRRGISKNRKGRERRESRKKGMKERRNR
ncbi:45e5dab3-edc8-44a2-a22d-f0cfdc7aba7a [Sclerotinia trifoliorum]|uniref:45e5dab3-edc8-44a2-a22d-f0cfdc7aba7a n=1 Tax=Sclerotinia trifoliorum TaxID=28548 RepID=A0A8H2VT02_9HELO|nr:45e5dab3-edc8-44a2-a22d-f0cfdc7aba7a [Sclerotinia trifoliorum]